MKSAVLAEELQTFHDKGLGLLVDTNLLLLYFAGGFRRDLIHSFKRTAEFSEDDFTLLAQVVYHFKRVATTPHILTEVSNLLGQHREPERSALLRLLGAAVEQWGEECPPAKRLVGADYFPRFGLTDTGIVDVSGVYLVLTNERSLADFLARRRAAVVNFRELQTLCL